MPQTVGAGASLEVEVEVRTDDGRRETLRPAPLRVLGPAHFVLGPSWSDRRCDEGDTVVVGGAVEGIPAGAAVRVTVEVHAHGPAADGAPTARSEVVAVLSAEVGEVGVFGAEWRAERADRLHDEAVATG